MLGGQGLEIFRGDVKKMEGKLYKNGDIGTVNKKDIPEKPQGVASTPLCRRGLKMSLHRSERVL